MIVAYANRPKVSMRKNAIVVLLLVFAIAAAVVNGSGERSVDEEVKKLSQRY